MGNAQIEIPRERIETFCGKWKIKELAIFGSAIRTDFRADSDVDILVEFHPDAQWNLWDFIHAEEELKDIFGRPVDLVEKSAVQNPFRRKHILNHREVIYTACESDSLSI